MLLRFGDILGDRIRLINESFQPRPSERSATRARTAACIPIKVNQQQQVVEEIVDFGRRYHHGLEAGSKAELIAALAYMDDPEALHRLQRLQGRGVHRPGAVRARRWACRPSSCSRCPSELALILERAPRMGVRPRLGVRVKLSTPRRRALDGVRRRPQHVRPERRRRSSRWWTSCAQREHAGLPADAALPPRLADPQHPQHPRRRSRRRAASTWTWSSEGAAMGILNIGGGLAVDYDGSHTNFASSSNYTIDEYCRRRRRGRS